MKPSPVFLINTKEYKKYEIFSGIFTEIFHKCEMAFNSGVFLKREMGICFVKTRWVARHDDHFLVNNLQNTESSRLAVWWPFFRRSPCNLQENTGSAVRRAFFCRSLVFLFCNWCCDKTASQSFSYGIFAITSGHFRTFSSARTESEKLEGTLTFTTNGKHVGRWQLDSNIRRKLPSLCSGQELGEQTCNFKART